MNKPELSEIRNAIGKLDQELLAIFAKRRELSLKVAQTKYQNQLDIRDQSRERKLLKQLISQAEEVGINPSTTLNFFQNIIEDSIRSQYDYFLNKATPMPAHAKLALLGETGSYSQLAAENHYATKSSNYELSYHSSFSQIFQHVSEQQADFAFVPIENTTSGSIAEIYDLILEYDLKIIGEEKLKIKHCLVGTEQTDLKSLRKVYSHPQAIAQCQVFFHANPHISRHYRSSTSSAVAFISDKNSPELAAIASETAANKAGLNIIQAKLSNHQENYTRFLLLAREPIRVPKNIPAKTSMSFHTQQQAGALADCLLVLKNNRINITKLESRPIPNKPWQEMFYLDFEGNVSAPQVKKALLEFEQISSQLQLLGCYPQHDIVATDCKIESH